MLTFTTGCVALPAPLLRNCPPPGHSKVLKSADGARASTTLDVLTYNIEGLAWPARGRRGGALRRINATLKNMREHGTAPDVVMVQEMFSRSAVRAVRDLGYLNMVSGPSRTQGGTLPDDERMPPPFRWSKGEIGVHLVNSGLAILSRYPIVQVRSEPFGKHRCAGLDCLSNKGILYARIAIPGVPGTINLFNTHLNSQASSRVSPRRHARAHRLQVDALGAFITAVGDRNIPTVVGGDFNMKASTIRFERFRNVTEPFAIVQRYCTDNPLPCDVRQSWDGDEPWMDTQDLQLFESGSEVQIHPIRIEAMFDGSADSPRLSDHDGVRVTYQLTWSTKPMLEGAGGQSMPICSNIASTR
ncbi:endonuclease/exonuclease/phosphatase family protein [Sphingomonas sp. CFBP 8760]|uniref:endonuclease/exonuclease/phosphatase family protein n=1 Tax=Sphingomonas sp. CFBP 8760 TaxID=2775282 RepID=UPI00178596A4|nr:endonuclease/exonuclease/phosphatase family protein [Sphingomonas sp. CFBP 8760]MBD8546868.1 endonuclease/exonuclease/phosphatase family protein [Sphingomonas sp. CFBP 8760]